MKKVLMDLEEFKILEEIFEDLNQYNFHSLESMQKCWSTWSIKCNFRKFNVKNKK